jgi:hypothetical protein
MSKLPEIGQQMSLYGLLTQKSDFALGLQVYNTKNIFSYSKMD